MQSRSRSVLNIRNLEEGRQQRKYNNLAMSEERFETRDQKVLSFYQKCKNSREETPKLDANFNQILNRKKFRKQERLFKQNFGKSLLTLPPTLGQLLHPISFDLLY